MRELETFSNFSVEFMNTLDENSEILLVIFHVY